MIYMREFFNDLVHSIKKLRRFGFEELKKIQDELGDLTRECNIYSSSKIKKPTI